MDHRASPNDRTTRTDGGNSGINLLDLQIKRHERHEKSESYLGQAVNWAVDLVRGSESDTLSTMKELKASIEQNQKSNNSDRVKELEKQIDDLVKSDQSVLAWRKEVSHYGSGVLKTGALFFPGGRGRAAAALLYGADQAHVGDSFSNQAIDGGLGVLKGGLMHKAMSSLGAGTVGVAGKGVMIGMASRGLDISLDRRSYTGANGFEPAGGLSKLAAHVVDPAAWMADGATFVVAHGLVKGADKFTGGLVERCRPIQTMGTGFSFGMTSGALNEIDRQRGAGEGLDLSKIAARSFVQGGFDAVAAIPGGLAASPGSTGAIRDSLKRFFSRESVTHGRSTAANSVALDSATMRPLVNSLEKVSSESSQLHTGRQHSDNLKESNSAGSGQAEGTLLSKVVSSTKMLQSEKSGSISSGAQMEAAESTSVRSAQKQRPSTLSDERLADGKRVITKSDGSVVTITANETVIQKDGVKITKRPGQPTIAEGLDGKPFVRVRVEDSVPKHERPLNASSRNGENIGKEISNFSHRPFTLDGVTYGSVEAFYSCLKVTDPVRRAEIAKLHGPEAKAAVKDLKSVTEGTYQDRTFKLGSPEHHELVKMAIRAKFEQNPNLAEEFVKTYPRPIIHKLQRPESKTTKYPSAVFTETLAAVRQELVDKAVENGSFAMKDGKLVKVSQGDKRSSGKEMNDQSATNELKGSGQGSNESKPISDLFKTIVDESAQGWHDFKQYAKAFEGTDMKGRSYLGADWQTVRIALEDGNVLNVTPNLLAPEMGTRPFDVPILKRGSLAVGDKTVNYFVQPKTMPAIFENYQDLYSSIESQGYSFTDPGLHQVGYFQGRTYLINPLAVSRIGD